MRLRESLAEAVLVPLWRLRNLATAAQIGTRVLMYHAIGTRIPDDVRGRYTLAPERFAAQMEVLARSGLNVGKVGAPDAEVAITFDDGYRDNLMFALPILERLGYPFTIFVTSGFAQSACSLYLGANELRRLASHRLATIGAHGKTHGHLTELNDLELRSELVGAKSWLEEVTGVQVRSLSYPHGAVDARVRAAVADAGYTLACTSEFGGNEPHRDSLTLRRIDVWTTDDEGTFESKLNGDWDWMRYFTRCGL